MTGKQIRFFFTATDEDRFFQEIEKRDDVFITDKNLELGIPKIKSLNENFQTQIWIKSHKSHIYMNSNGYIDRDKSDVIEYSRSITEAFFKSRYPNLKEQITSEDRKYLRNGRLWIAMKYLNHDKDDFIEKANWFKDWYSIYAKWIKKYCRLNKDKNYYMGEDAFKAYKEGKIIIDTGSKNGGDWE